MLAVYKCVAKLGLGLESWANVDQLVSAAAAPGIEGQESSIECGPYCSMNRTGDDFHHRSSNFAECHFRTLVSSAYSLHDICVFRSPA